MQDLLHCQNIISSNKSYNKIFFVLFRFYLLVDFLLKVYNLL